MGCFASRVKTDWNIDPQRLLKQSNSIAHETLTTLEEDGFHDDSLPLWQPDNFLNEAKKKPALRQFATECNELILSNSISPIPLHKALVLLEQIRKSTTRPFMQHQLLALAKAIVYRISNLRFGPEVGVGKVKIDAPVVSAWQTEIEAMARDILLLKEASDVASHVHHGDSRSLGNILKSESIDAVITSPPYPNEKDYSRTTRLESVFLGMISTKAELRTIKQSLIRSNTRSVYKNDEDDLLVASHAEIQRIAQQIEDRRIELGKTSGFERLYARVTKLYFGGMVRHLSDLRQALRPGAMLAYVVGDQASYLRVMIRTGQILAHLAESLGYQVQSIDLFRTRLATATQEQLREEVVVLRWPSRAKSRKTGAE